MDFRILGPLQVLDGERSVDVGGGKQRSVLALLLLHANEVVPSDRLIDELWPDQPPPSAAKIVQAHVSRLRKALNGAGDGLLLTRGQGYVLRVEAGELDVDRFQVLLDNGREALAAGDVDGAAETLRHAAALWRGPPLADFAYDSFAQDEIGRLEDLRLAALEERIEADLALGRHNEVVQELEQLVRRHPLRERLRGQLMLALYRAGRHAEALEVYRDARRTLADELGLEPSPTLQQLERAILTHDVGLAAPARRSARERRRRKAGVFVAAGALLLIAAAIAVAATQLTGRDARGLPSLAPNSVGAIDAETNRIVGQIPVGSPGRIAFGGSGVWVVSEEDRTFTRIDAASRTVLRTVPAGGAPVDVVVGKDAVWLLLRARTTLSGRARIARVDPRLNDIVATMPIELDFAPGPTQSLAAADGMIWAASPYPQVTVSRVDTASDRVAATFRSGGPNFGFDSGDAGGVPGSSGLAVGKGAVWVGSDVGVVRIGTDSDAVSETIELGVIPTALAIGEGSLWVVARPGFRCCPVEAVGTGTLARIDPATNSVVATIPIGGNPAGIAVGEGSVWIADPGTRSIVRVDAEKNEVVARVKVGARPRGIAVGGGFVWVSAG